MRGLEWLLKSFWVKAKVTTFRFFTELVISPVRGAARWEYARLALATVQHSSAHKYEHAGPRRTTSDRSVWNNWTKMATRQRPYLDEGDSVIYKRTHKQGGDNDSHNDLMKVKQVKKVCVLLARLLSWLSRVGRWLLVWRRRCLKATEQQRPVRTPFTHPWDWHVGRVVGSIPAVRALPCSPSSGVNATSRWRLRADRAGETSRCDETNVLWQYLLGWGRWTDASSRSRPSNGTRKVIGRRVWLELTQVRALMTMNKVTLKRNTYNLLFLFAWCNPLLHLISARCHGSES